MLSANFGDDIGHLSENGRGDALARFVATQSSFIEDTQCVFEVLGQSAYGIPSSVGGENICRRVAPSNDPSASTRHCSVGLANNSRAEVSNKRNPTTCSPAVSDPPAAWPLAGW